VQNNSTWTALQRSPIDWPRDSFRVVVAVLAAVGAVAIVFVGTTVALALAMALGELTVADLQHRPPRLPTDFQLWSQYALYVPLVVYLALVILPVSRLSWHSLGFRPLRAADVWVALGGTFLMWVAVAVTGTAIETLTHRHDTEAAIALLKTIHSPTQEFAFILMAVVVAPLVEEFAFRVFLFNAFLRWTPFWVAAGASGLLFGFAHAQTPSQLLTVGIPLAAGGVVLAAVYDRTRCYWANVLTHALFNSVSVIAFFVFHVTA
jgi:membrane protease YdiL (CAAX protease family)